MCRDTPNSCSRHLTVSRHTKQLVATPQYVETDLAADGDALFSKSRLQHDVIIQKIREWIWTKIYVQTSKESNETQAGDKRVKKVTY
jgi:hypothetical protein